GLPGSLLPRWPGARRAGTRYGGRGRGSGTRARLGRSGGGGFGGAVRAGRVRVRGPERRAGIGGGARTRGNQERSFARLPRHVLRHEARDGVDQLVARAVGQDLEQVLEITFHRRPVRSVALDDADLVDGGGDGVLGARHELLGEFLAGAESGERDLN